MVEKKKRILIVMPMVSDGWNTGMREVLSRYLSPGFEIDFVNVRYGGIGSVTGRGIIVSLPYIIAEIVNAARKGYDAAIPNCFFDPGVPESRTLVSIPVVGPGESALHLACMLGYRVGIIETTGTPVDHLHGKGTNRAQQWVRRHGLSERVISIRTVPMVVEDLRVDAEVTLDAMYQASLIAIEQDGAEVLILGCTGMTGYAEELQKKLDVPVVEPLVAALKIAEMLITMELKQSKLAFPSESDVSAKVQVRYPPTLKI